MKTFDELVKQMAGKTELQQANLFGTEVQLTGVLMQINTTFLSCLAEPPRPGCLVGFKEESHKKQLLEYSVGDGVRMNARFTGFSSGGGDCSDTYHFDLVSIVRLYTREEKERQKAHEKEKQESEEKSRSGCFVATAAYGTSSPVVLVLREYRDWILTKDVIGRAAVRFYYAMSPPLARFIATSARRRLIARLFLGPVIFFARQQLEAFRKRKIEDNGYFGNESQYNITKGNSGKAEGNKGNGKL